jgi:hypothetical protein
MGYFIKLERTSLQVIRQGESREQVEEKLKQQVLQIGFFNLCFNSELTRSQPL